ncbi:MAG: ComF family protein [Hyphomicrobiales bacterium]|nr:ComF family protein [Hyphomicrobiales bacterium]
MRRAFQPAISMTGDFARRLGGAALDLVYPPVCCACRRATAAQDALCAQCWSAMRFIERPYCERLGAPFPADLGQSGLLSPEAVADPPAFGRARAVALFADGPARLLVHRLKYYDRMEVARPMARWMARAGAELIAEADALTPMPMHRLRLAQRGYNQAATLASALSRETGAPVLHALERVRNTTPQVGLSRAQRARNLQGAFRTPEAARLGVLDRRLLLVDDVMTSGASANAAARALLRAGAKSVDVLCFARVVSGG